MSDSFINSTELLVHFDGPVGTNTFIDKRGNSISTFGNTSVAANASAFGGVAGHFDGAGDYLRVPAGAWALGNGNFTIDVVGIGTCVGHILTNSGSYGGLYGFKVESTSTQIHFAFLNTGGTFIGVIAVNKPATGRWHAAVCRVGSNITAYINGEAAGSINVGTQGLYAGSVLTIGAYYDNGFLNGDIDEIRLTKAGRYTEPFSPPDAPFSDFGIAALTGTVRDSAGNPIARTVRSYRSSDGLFVDETISDGSTGGFSVGALDMTEHFVVVHDPVKNAMVYDHVQPLSGS